MMKIQRLCSLHQRFYGNLSSSYKRLHHIEPRCLHKALPVVSTNCSFGTFGVESFSTCTYHRKNVEGIQKDIFPLSTKRIIRRKPSKTAVAQQCQDKVNN